MNEANKKSVWKFIQKHGDFLKDKLEPHPNHPNGRNPYAHICLLINQKFSFFLKKDFQFASIFCPEEFSSVSN